MSTNERDRVLLELAAKAAGIEIKTIVGDTFWAPDGIVWNPLAEDGDALRLAVMLQITPTQWGSGAGGGCTAETIEIDGEFDEPYNRNNDDPLAATRRAIVRAAAEIGKQRS